MFARLLRIVPMLIVLAVVAAIVYIVAAWRYSPAHQDIHGYHGRRFGVLPAGVRLRVARAQRSRVRSVVQLFVDGSYRACGDADMPRGVFAPQPRVPHQGREDDDSGFPCQALAGRSETGIGASQIKNSPQGVREKANWRRSRDSNPRCPCGAYSLSRRAPSASRSALRGIIGAVCYDTVTTSKLQGA